MNTHYEPKQFSLEGDLKEGEVIMMDMGSKDGGITIEMTFNEDGTVKTYNEKDSN